MTATPYSPFRRVGNLVSFSGLVGRRAGAVGEDLAAQIRMIFEQLDAVLDEVGLRRSDIFKTTVWLSDIADWADMTEHYLRYFEGLELPTRSAVGAALPPGFLVELEAWAHHT